MTLKRFCSILSVLLVFGILTKGQDKQNENRKNGRDMFATKQQFSKGGIGLISSRRLYVDLKSSSNELILKPTPETELR